MRKLLKIRRQASRDEECYTEEYEYYYDDSETTIATALKSLRETDRISVERDIPYRPIEWECSCLQKKCGACAMVIAGKPSLACDVKLSDIREETISIEPLRKFPVVRDLIVDRTAMMDKLKELSVWFNDDATTLNEEDSFEASRCLQCGLCLEVCPNFAVGEVFGGMAAMTPMSRLILKAQDSERGRLKKSYTAGVYEGCGKSLACRDICPAHIDMERLLVKSNGAAVWNRRWKK